MAYTHSRIGKENEKKRKWERKKERKCLAASIFTHTYKQISISKIDGVNES